MRESAVVFSADSDLQDLLAKSCRHIFAAEVHAAQEFERARDILRTLSSPVVLVDLRPEQVNTQTRQLLAHLQSDAGSAIDLVIAVNQSDPTYFCAHFHALATALHLQVFDQSDGVSILKKIPVSVSNFSSNGFSEAIWGEFMPAREALIALSSCSEIGHCANRAS